MHTQKNLIVGILIIPFIALTVVTQLYIFLPVSKSLQILLGNSSNNMELLTTLFGIFYAGGLIIWGGLSDKIGRERSLTIGLALLASVSFILPFIKNYDLLLFTRAIQGFCAASFPAVAISWQAENLTDSAKPRAISLISCAFLLAGTTGQWFGSLTIINSLHTAMWSLASIYALGAILFHTLSLSKNAYHQSTQRTSLLSIFYQLPKILFHRNLFRIYFCALFVLLSFVALYSVLNLNLVAAKIATLRNISIISILFSLTASYVFKFIKPLYVLTFSLFVMSISLFVHFIFLHNQSQGNAVIFLAHFIFILGLAYAIPSMIACVALQADIKTRGIATSLYACILFIGASIGAFLPAIIPHRFLIPLISVALFLSALQLILIKKNQGLS